jgi:HEAT repeat protein
MAVAADKTPPDLASLLARLAHPGQHERVAALALLLAHKMVPQALEAIQARLEDESERVRRTAILVLTEAGAPATDALAIALGERQPAPLRIMAAVGIARAGAANPAAIRALAGCLAAKETDLRFNASLALGKIGAPAVPSLCEALGNPEATVRIGAADALGYGGAAAKGALPELKSAGAETAPIALRIACAAAIVKISGEAGPGLRLLLAGLADTDPKRRADSLRRIGELRDLGRDAAPAIVKCLGDADSGVRAAAALTLAQIQAVTNETAAILIRTLNDAEPAVRANAAIALSSAPAEAGAATAKLREMQSDLDPRARAAAKAALERIVTADRKA